MKRLKIKKIVFQTLLITILVTFLILATHITAAGATDTWDGSEDGYQLLAPLPGLDKKIAEKSILEEYLPAVFKIAIGLAAVFAILMIVIGGFQYMSTDAFQKKEDGKKRVTNAIKGLVLVIAAWLILNEINPNLLKFDLSIKSAEVKTEAPPEATPN